MNITATRARKNHKLLIFSIVAMLLATLAWYLNNYVSIDELAEQESRLRESIALNPWRSFVIGFSIYTVLALVPGTGGKAIAYGWLFGFWQAVTIVTVGLTIAAMVIFSLSRYLIRESIERRYSTYLSLMNKHLEKEGAFYLITLRMLHAPFSIVNPVSGASRVHTWTFCWTTVVGLLPANSIWVYVGIRLPSLHELAHRAPESFIDFPLLAALLLCGTLPFLIRWLIGHFGIPIRKDHNRGAIIHEPQKDKR
jgi:uncharacterized membrane protein YdjX (TVP38/TMEM64 family)